MIVDFKITTWERVEIPTKHKAKVINALKSGKISNANDLIEFLEDGIYCGVVGETTEQLTPEKNEGCCTIEVLNDCGNNIWDNA